MKCIRCGRALGPKPAATVQTRQGLSAWGPVCARRAGLIAPKTRQRAIKPVLKASEPDPSQMTLELAA